jgi:predicted outer membrane repeat protein
MKHAILFTLNLSKAKGGGIKYNKCRIYFYITPKRLDTWLKMSKRARSVSVKI